MDRVKPTESSNCYKESSTQQNSLSTLYTNSRESMMTKWSKTYQKCRIFIKRVELMLFQDFTSLTPRNDNLSKKRLPTVMTSLSKCMYSACVSYVHKKKRKRGIEVRAFSLFSACDSFIFQCLVHPYHQTQLCQCLRDTSQHIRELGRYFMPCFRAQLYSSIQFNSPFFESQLYVLFSDGQSATQGD